MTKKQTINRMMCKLEAIKKRREKSEIRKVFARMTTEQLLTLVEGNPDDKYIKEVFESVDGLWILERFGD